MNIQSALEEPESRAASERGRTTRDSVVIRFAGDSGDGIQSAGTQFGLEAALGGNDLATFPDFPSEIRAPAGSPGGVSSFQIHFSSREIHTPGDRLDCLVALNPAALTIHLKDLLPGGMLIVDTGAFRSAALKKAGYETDPLQDGSLEAYHVLAIDISTMTRETVASLEDVDVSSKKDALKARNMWVLGLVYWVFGRDRHSTLDWIDKKFAKKPTVRTVNRAAIEAGYAFGATAQLPTDLDLVTVPPAKAEPGLYRTVTGGEAIAYALVAGAHAHGVDPVYCSYPITPASSMLHALAKLGETVGVKTFQAEDEIAAVCAAIGASFAGTLGITGTSGPGMALKGEALGLAVGAELPLVIVNVQRGGPSTGLPTKVEQADLYQAAYGRHGDSPMPVVAISSPADAFDVTLEAIRLAVTFMTPVVVLSDGYIANASEPWRIPKLADLPRSEVKRTIDGHLEPFYRDPETLARPWVKPGMKGGIHRLGGLERKNITGEVSYDADNHQTMTDLRTAKIAGIADHIPEQTVTLGASEGDVAVVSWGSTFGAVTDAVEKMITEGKSVSHIHMTHLVPFPRNLGALLGRFKRIIVPELNTGQLVTMIRAEYLIPAEPLSKVAGQPFHISEIEEAVDKALQEVRS